MILDVARNRKRKGNPTDPLQSCAEPDAKRFEPGGAAVPGMCRLVRTRDPDSTRLRQYTAQRTPD